MKLIISSHEVKLNTIILHTTIFCYFLVFNAFHLLFMIWNIFLRRSDSLFEFNNKAYECNIYMILNKCKYLFFKFVLRNYVSSNQNHLAH